MKQLIIRGINEQQPVLDYTAILLFSADPNGKPYGGTKGVITRYYDWRILCNLYRFKEDPQALSEFIAEMEMNKQVALDNYRRHTIDYSEV